MLRQDRLHMFINMRSNDAFLGLPHDIFCFTMIQEIVARTLSVELGSYKHVAGSLHLYDTDTEAAQQFLGEGWQSTQAPMPPMPAGDPWSEITLLLRAESAIRTTGTFDDDMLGEAPSYWADLIRLLQVFRWKKREGGADKIKELRGRMSSGIYLPFIDKLLSQLP
jgi:thymidylate synthase